MQNDTKLISGFEEISEADLTGVLARGVNVQEDDKYEKPIAGRVADVVNGYPWYAGKQATATALNKIPRAILVEKSQILSSLLSGALYYINTIIRTGQKGANAAASTEFGNKLKSHLQGIQASEVDNLSTKLQETLESFKNAQNGEMQTLEANKLTSLLGIYLTEPTGFKYVLPHLDGPYSTGGDWADEGQGAIAGLINKGMSVVDEISSIANIMSPGVYIQKPKYFNFDQGGKEVSFKFPLFNTTQGSNYKRNYELLWLLTYQNKPYKTSFARTLPGKIYSLVLPGIASMPYAYMSELSIDFKGTTRLLEVDTPARVKVPIPDAYVVNVKFTSLLNDYANTMVGSAIDVDLGLNRAISNYNRQGETDLSRGQFNNIA